MKKHKAKRSQGRYIISVALGAAICAVVLLLGALHWMGPYDRERIFEEIEAIRSITCFYMPFMLLTIGITVGGTITLIKCLTREKVQTRKTK